METSEPGNRPALPRSWRWLEIPVNIFRAVVLGRSLLIGEPGAAPRLAQRTSGSLTRRMIGIAGLWIFVLLAGGGYALERVFNTAVTRNFDSQLDYELTAMVATAEVDSDGDVHFTRSLGDQRFLEPQSGLYFQVSGDGHESFRSRSLWDRALVVNEGHHDLAPHLYDTKEFNGEPLRVLERDLTLPGAKTVWRFQVAQARAGLDDQIAVIRRTLVRSFALLGLGLIIMSASQATFGLWPLRKVRRQIGDIRDGRRVRVDARLPIEIAPMVEELNDLLAHNAKQAEEARAHAGNLAHALKTPLTVIMNEATANTPELGKIVVREATTMRRQVDHHLARARAVGRRGAAQSVADLWPSVEAVERAVSRLYPNVTIDIDGDRTARARVERQDLDEMLGNLIENAAKYGGSRVFVTISSGGGFVEALVEDDGVGIPESQRQAIFERGARLDTGKPGTGLGLAIVRDVAEIYGGSVALEESDDLGGLLARLRVPIA